MSMVITNNIYVQIITKLMIEHNYFISPNVHTFLFYQRLNFYLFVGITWAMRCRNL